MAEHKIAPDQQNITSGHQNETLGDKNAASDDLDAAFGDKNVTLHRFNRASDDKNAGLIYLDAARKHFNDTCVHKNAGFGRKKALDSRQKACIILISKGFPRSTSKFGGSSSHMNDNNRRRLEAGQRCRQWIVDYAALITPLTLFETKTAEMTTVVNQLEDIAGEIQSAIGEGLSATDVKSSVRQDLIDDMEKVRRAAKAAEPDHPGTQDRYRMSRNLSNELLLARGRSFAEGGLDDQALLEGYGAPASWPASITVLCDNFEAAMGQQDSAKGSSVGKNALFNEKMDLMMQLKRTLSLMVPNFCAGNTAAIAAWNSAAHVEEPPKKSTPPTP